MALPLATIAATAVVLMSLLFVVVSLGVFGPWGGPEGDTVEAIVLVLVPPVLVYLRALVTLQKA